MNKLYGRLARTNLKNNKPLYIPYILAGVMTVALFYLMVFLNNNPGLDQMRGGYYIKTIMGMGVYIIAFFSLIFLFYTNSFIIKRRKREIGVYNILGMEKRHIARVLFIETVYVAVLAIAGGLLVGIGSSKLILMMLYRLLDVEENVIFVVTKAGITYAIPYFCILYLLIFGYNLLQIRLSNPVALLHGSNVGEKEPKTKIVMTVLGLVCIGIAYYISFTTENPLKVLTLFFVAVILVIVGTYFLFTAGSIALLKLLRRDKLFYYNKKHFSAVSGLLYRMKQNAAGLASICVLATMVLVMVSITVSLYAGVDDELYTRYPQELCVYLNYGTPGMSKEGIAQEIRQEVEKQGRTITKSCVYEKIPAFTTDDGTEFSAVTQKEYNGNQTVLYLVTREDLLQMDDSLEAESVQPVKPGSVRIYGGPAVYTADTVGLWGNAFSVESSELYQNDDDMHKISLLKGCYYVMFDSEETIKSVYSTYGDGPIDVNGVIGFDYDGSKGEKIACYQTVDSQLERIKASAGEENRIDLYAESRAWNETEVYALYGGLFFLGAFLGIMFLIVTVMLIFYKQISEGYEDKERYVIMEKVGMSSEEVKESITSQIRIVFFLPLVVAAIHELAAFPIVRRLLALLNLTNVRLYVICMGITFLLFSAIYYIVFRVTSQAYYRIVDGKAR